ncbi:hypothetical protein C8J56DRAFT_1058575 [Mycena floridula]|nr:hypothetical protein C8J56DRAFT_1058575 [Mycena floridula]
MTSTASYNVQSTSSSYINPSNTTQTSAATFRAPAHKHAHHLHSIPPREKSTRTLIIDHMLWVHGRTRFAQARAELGMTDPTGGLSSPNYIHRNRPENYEEEDEASSEGEDVVTLKARAGDPGRPHNDAEDERLRTQDLLLARTLRLRAEGLEKVVTSMLDQPPPIHPIVEDEFLSPPTSPKLKAAHPHTLPNGVRLRIALGTMINDLFARQAPPPPFRDQIQSPRLQSKPAATSSSLPAALAPLSSISAYSSSTTNYSGYPGYVSANTRIPVKPNSRTHLLYMAGADPSTANSPPSLRCPRHLHTGCEICVEAKSNSRPGLSPRVNGDAGGQWKGLSGMAPDGGGITGWQDGSGVGSGLARHAAKGCALRRKSPFSDEITSSGGGNTKLSELIPRFLRISALAAAELGRELREDDESSPSKEGTITSSPVSTFELQPNSQNTGDFSLLPPPASPTTSRAVAQAQERLYSYVLRPSRAWYMLLVGLLTRAALEGYLTAGWRGSDAVECLLTCGLGATDVFTTKEPEDPYTDLEPDELPSLLESVRILFPATRSSSREAKAKAEEEFEMEMDGRLRKFYDIPESTPDLSTHMEDLAWQYPAEPVERAAVRFCEAMSRWRGKPELETYKKRRSEAATSEKVSIDSYFTMPSSSPPNSFGKRPREGEDIRPGTAKRLHLLSVAGRWKFKFEEISLLIAH